MKELIDAIRLESLLEAKKKIETAYKDGVSQDDEEFSHALFRGKICQGSDTVINAHLKSLNLQLGKVLNPTYEHFKEDALYLEFCKGITTFDRITGSINLDGGTFGDSFIASQNLYLSAISSFRKYVPNFYQGDLELSLAPLKLRLAIELYFKNMIGFIEAKSEVLMGRNKGKTTSHPVSISDLLSFFSNDKYKGYAKIPMSISIIKDINYWSNNLVHTGIVSYPWQSMTAIDFLKPLFYTGHEKGNTHIEGFNYLDLAISQEQLVRDLNTFLSNKQRKVEVSCLERTDRPLEGAYYYA